MNDDAEQTVAQEIRKERESLAALLHERLEVPMLILSVLWLVLFVVEVIRGLTPILEIAGLVIWGLFVVEFGLGFLLAPRKIRYLQRNWLGALSLAAPAFRLFRIVRLLRIARAARLARGLRMLRDAGNRNTELASASAIEELRQEIVALRRELDQFTVGRKE